MSRRTKIWMITAALLVILGMIMFAASMTVNKWDFTKLSTVKYETNTYQVNEKFCNISMKTDTANILFVPSEDGICKVDCYEQGNANHNILVSDDTLTISLADTRKWYEYIGISIGEPRITIYLPEKEYAELSINESTGFIEIPKEFKFESVNISASTGDVKCYASASELINIKTTTGDICVENAAMGSLNLSVSTGKVTAASINCEGNITIGVTTGKTDLTDVKCESLTSAGSTGSISLKNVIASEKFSVERTTGSVKFDSSDAAEVFVRTNTGNVKGSLLSDKVFITETSTGNVSVPKSVKGGKCEISTDTGNINIEIK